jgi:hypothetical protein
MKFKLLTVVVSFAGLAFAQSTDVAALYDVSTEGTSTVVKSGQKGKVVLSIKAKGGAHVSDEAPLKIELSGKQLTLDKNKLTLADSVTQKKAGSTEYPNPQFEVAFTPTAPGKATVDAKLTFFICTDKVCARQSKTLSLPVEIN